MLDTPNFVSFCPYASRFPFETWILPKNHNSHYENIQKNEVDELGTVLKTILMKLEIGPGQAGVQLHHPHLAVRHADVAALPLAHGDHPAADARGRLRVGHGLLHQPGAAGAGGGVPARDRGGRVGRADTVRGGDEGKAESIRETCVEIAFYQFLPIKHHVAINQIAHIVWVRVYFYATGRTTEI